MSIHLHILSVCHSQSILYIKNARRRFPFSGIFRIPEWNLQVIRLSYFSIFTMWRYSVTLPDEIFRIYIPGARVARLLMLKVFPPPATIILLVFRIISPVIEIRLISKLPDILVSNETVKKSLKGLG